MSTIVVDFNKSISWERIVELAINKRRGTTIELINVNPGFYYTVPHRSHSQLIARTTYWGRKNDKRMLVFGIANWDRNLRCNMLFSCQVFPLSQDRYFLDPVSIAKLVQAFKSAGINAVDLAEYNTPNCHIGILEGIMMARLSIAPADR